MLEVLAVLGVAVLAVLVVLYLPAVGFTLFFLMYVWSNPVVQNLVLIPTIYGHQDLTLIGCLAFVLSMMFIGVTIGWNLWYLKNLKNIL